MSSRDKILATVKNNQPEWKELPSLDLPDISFSSSLSPSASAASSTGASTSPSSSSSDVAAAHLTDLSQKFISVLEAIGGNAFVVSGFSRIATLLKEQYPDARRFVSTCPELSSIATQPARNEDPHLLENVDVAVLRAHFGVAENGACWITEDLLVERALPFITQHLALVINKKDIVPDMHAAYARIADASYGFGVFIAGPSKTADIEQSLVLGAHGPRSMMVFLIDEGTSDAGFF